MRGRKAVFRPVLQLKRRRRAPLKMSACLLSPVLVFLAAETADAGDGFAAQVHPAVARSVSPDIYVTQVRNEVFAYDRRIHPACDDRRMTAWISFDRIEDPLTHNYRTRGAAAVYKQQVRVEGCSAPPRLHNFLVITAQDPSHPPVLTSAIPGTSRTSPYIQYNVQKFFFSYVARQLGALCLDEYQKGQAEAVLMRAEIRQDIEPVIYGDRSVVIKGAWTEEWALRLCERVFEEEFLFDADAEGTSYALLRGRSPGAALQALREKARIEADEASGQD